MRAEPNTEYTSACTEVDLSPRAIRQRLDEVGQLYELGIYLAQAKPCPSPETPSQPERRDVDPAVAAPGESGSF
jgi:hypothetical protein